VPIIYPVFGLGVTVPVLYFRLDTLNADMKIHAAILFVVSSAMGMHCLCGMWRISLSVLNTFKACNLLK
jgi:hypothetical protein